MKKILQQLMDYENFDKDKAKEVLINLTTNEYPASQVASFLTVFMMRGITLEELKGFREALLELCTPINLGTHDLMDVCGTGGDSKNTFNISTLTAFVLAGAGIPIAKHGNYGVTSVSGSSTVLQTLGIQFTNSQDLLLKQLEKASICFLHAPLFHPALKSVANIRKELQIKTFFNILGPLIHPAQPLYQFNGVFSLELARMYHFLLQQENKKYFVYYTLDGYDEISLTSEFKFFSNQTEGLLYPNDFGYSYVSPEALYGGTTPAESANIFMKILSGNGSNEQNQVIIANASLAIQLYKNCDLLTSKNLAKDSLFNLKALKCFEKLKIVNL